MQSVLRALVAEAYLSNSSLVGVHSHFFLGRVEPGQMHHKRTRRPLCGEYNADVQGVWCLTSMHLFNRTLQAHLA